MRRTAVAFCGLPGSGKTMLARKLAEAAGWQRLDRDELRREMFVHGGYSDADKRALGQTLRDRMAELLRVESVILDGMTFSRREEREHFASVARRAGGKWRLAWLDCPVALARERVAADGNHPAEDRNVALVDAVAARFDPPVDAIRIDAMLPPETQLRELIEALEVFRSTKNET